MSIYAKLKQVISNETDSSYPSPERQLLFRLNDLLERHNEILTLMELSPYNDYEDDYINDETLMNFSPPEEMKSIYLIEKAIKRAKKDLREIYGINPDVESGNNEDSIAEEWKTTTSIHRVVEQLLIFDYESFCTTLKTR